jgi:O-succinylbenzoate synthase
MSKVRVELRVVHMPLIRAFRTSRSSETARDLLVVRWSCGDVDGWGECAADPEPVFFPETLRSAHGMIETVLLPMLAEQRPGVMPAGRAHAIMREVPGNQLAKAAVESAILDAELRAHGMRLIDYLGGARTRVPVGVSVGIAADIPELLDWVGGYLADGYTRIKLKIQPGWDVEPVAAVRQAFGAELSLQVDANQAYGPSDYQTLRRLDEFGLLLLEQPFPKEELRAHAGLARRIDTPVCLDESVTGLHSAAAAIALGACDVVNIKPARVGGYLEARSIHDLCLAEGIPVFCGGVLESGVGRAANLALAALENFKLPGDISATSRYFSRDITQSFELSDGHLEVPTGAGTGAQVDLEALESMTEQLTAIDL